MQNLSIIKTRTSLKNPTKKNQSQKNPQLIDDRVQEVVSTIPNEGEKTEKLIFIEIVFARKHF